MSPDPADAAVEVAYALPDQQRVVQVAWRAGLTAGEAVEASGLPQDFPEIDVRPRMLGIFGRRVDASQALSPGDRVEIYRPLDDPKERRRRRVAEAKAGSSRRGP